MQIARQLAFTTSLLASVAFAAPFWAQATATEGDAAETGGGIQEVIVAARKTAENLQTTPVAVSALTGADLEKQQIVSVAQLQTATPNFTVSSAVAQPRISDAVHSWPRNGARRRAPFRLSDHVRRVLRCRRAKSNEIMRNIICERIFGMPKG